MGRKTKTIDFDLESQAELDAIRKMIGQKVPLSAHYVAGPRPVLIAIENDLCTLQFPNGVEMRRVPIRDLVDNLSYWQIRKSTVQRDRDAGQ